MLGKTKKICSILLLYGFEKYDAKSNAFLFIRMQQISANNSTRYRYSKITRKLGIIQGQVLRRIGGSDYIRVTTLISRFDWGHRTLIFTSKTNLESEPRFAKIWCAVLNFYDCGAQPLKRLFHPPIKDYAFCFSKNKL